MKKVAKLIMVDPEDSYLLMYRSEHPMFPNDPDLPGGIVEETESSRESTIREVKEETGIAINLQSIKEIYSGTEYSRHGTQYSLFICKLQKRPALTISWEHASYEWLDKKSFLEKAKSASDTYMHMVYQVVK